jgi:phosphatidylglycerol---prolipoprotein diacylglyceryl transferase
MQQVILRIPWTKFGLFPDGIPIYGFGMMLFIAFIVCTWLAGRRASKAVLSGIGLGRYVAGPNEGDDFPNAADPKDQVEAAKALIQDLAIWLFITGLAGARITYMIHHPQVEGGFLAQLIDITNGGIILYGSIIGALAGYLGFCLYLYLRRRVVLNTLRIADLAAPSVALGIGLGRIGCLLNGCCYGHVACADCRLVYPVHFPMSAPPRYVLVEKGYQTAAGFTFADHQPERGVRVGTVDPESAAAKAGLKPGDIITEVNGKKLDPDPEKGMTPREILTKALFLDWPRGQKDLELKVEPDGLAETKTLDFRPQTLGLYPTQVFETISMTLLFLLLLAFFPFRSRDGQVMALLMMCYAVHRTLNELLRDDQRPVGFESYSSYILFAAGALLMIWVTLRPRQYKSEWELVN